MDLNRNPPILFDAECLRFDSRVDFLKLTFPVLSHFLPAMHPATFPSIWPIHLTLHFAQNRRSFATVERGIDLPEKFNARGFCVRFRHTSSKQLSYAVRRRIRIQQSAATVHTRNRGIRLASPCKPRSWPRLNAP